MKCTVCGKEFSVYEDRHEYTVVDVENGSAIVKCKEHKEGE